MKAPLGVVVVEDNDDVAQLVKALLEEDARVHVVGIADNAQSALELIERHTPALVVLDHALKGTVTGIMAAAMLKDIAPDTSIIMFSAYPVEDDAAVISAIDAFVTKFDFESLLPIAQRLLRLDSGNP